MRASLITALVALMSIALNDLHHIVAYNGWTLVFVGLLFGGGYLARGVEERR